MTGLQGHINLYYGFTFVLLTASGMTITLQLLKGKRTILKATCELPLGKLLLWDFK